MPNDDEIRIMMQDPTLSFWLRDALTRALARDPVDAAADAGLLSLILDRRLDVITAHNQAALIMQRMQLPPD